MTQHKNANRIQVKLELAEKYYRLASTSGGKNKKDVLRRRAEHYRRQAEELGR